MNWSLVVEVSALAISAGAVVWFAARWVDRVEIRLERIEVGQEKLEHSLANIRTAIGVRNKLSQEQEL